MPEDLDKEFRRAAELRGLKYSTLLRSLAADYVAAHQAVAERLETEIRAKGGASDPRALAEALAAAGFDQHVPG